jgi:lipoate-protein ligase A
MKWTEGIYRDVFMHPEFALKENDYVLGNRKCGGNAQYIKKERWLHHTSFLWDYSPEKMGYLLHPKKMPPYRQERSHGDFLCRLSDFFPDRDLLIDRLLHAMQKRFALRITSLEEALTFVTHETRQSTTIVHNA